MITRTEGGAAVSSKSEFLEYLEFYAEIRNSGFVTGCHCMPSFSSKKIQNDQIRTEGGVAF